jgi:hypothetical protein
MTHTKGEQVAFNYISIGRYYIIEVDNYEVYIYVTAADFDEDPGRTQIHYRFHEMRENGGQWRPYSLSVPYCPESTFTEAEGIKVFETEQPPPKRRRRGVRNPY